VKIGYPRALLYYKYFPLWERFFHQLGAEVVLSSPTNKVILNKGTLAADNELCLPVKVFYGHLLELRDKVDAIFIPRIVSVEKSAYTCPKFLGLPDMARAMETRIPEIWDPIIDLRAGWRKYLSSVISLGRKLSESSLKILLAYRKGVKALSSYRKLMLDGQTPIELLEKKSVAKSASNKLKIGLAGHPYNIYDRYISMNLVKRLRNMGVEVRTSEMLLNNLIEKQASKLPKELFWTYEKEVLGTVFHWTETGSVDGIIYVLSFACGPDSLVQVLLEHELKKYPQVPMMPLVIDEHSGEAGLITRVEAFIDMLQRKKVVRS
jgi:predicted nucleotide-binding protein (sugar kinase/HSP70/actin superfamily)